MKFRSPARLASTPTVTLFAGEVEPHDQGVSVALIVAKDYECKDCEGTAKHADPP